MTGGNYETGGMTIWVEIMEFLSLDPDDTTVRVWGVETRGEMAPGACVVELAVVCGCCGLRFQVCVVVGVK